MDEDDKTLQGLKEEWGDDIFMTAVNALKEVNEYNPSGMYPVPELWNLKENRKAELKEVIGLIVNRIKSHKRSGR